MQLNDTLARQIVSRAMKILSFSVNVMDERGLIIASGNPERLHQRHEGAVLALTENRVVEISDATARQLKGVRPGINLPIAYQGELLGVIGISGDPDIVRAYAELVRMTAELILEQATRIAGITRQIAEFGGLKAVMPKLVGAFLLITLASVALPGTHVPHFKPGKELRERVNQSTPD